MTEENNLSMGQGQDRFPKDDLGQNDDQQQQQGQAGQRQQPTADDTDEEEMFEGSGESGQADYGSAGMDPGQMEAEDTVGTGQSGGSGDRAGSQSGGL